MKNTISFYLVLLWVLILSSCKEKDKASGFRSITIKDNWQFSQAGKNEWLPAAVPGNVHIDLLSNKKINDPFYGKNEKELQWIENADWEYKTEFDVDKNTLEYTCAALVFKGLDTYAEVFLNDKKILEATNMFRDWRIDVKQNLKEGKNNLRIVFKSPITHTMPRYDSLKFHYPASNDQAEKKVSIFTRKAGYHYGWDWGPRFVTSGIWRPVFLETWNKARIDNVHLIQKSLSGEKAVISAKIEIDAAEEGQVEVEVMSEDASVVSATTVVNLKKGLNNTELVLEVKNPKVWWPSGLGEQPLYKFKTTIRQDKAVVGENTQRIGLRTVEVVSELDKDGKSLYFKVNGVPVFMKGANYIPSDNFLNRVDEKKYQMLLNSAVAANMNMLRVWGGGIYEEDRFYELCDEKGILIWQDFMFACSMYPGDEKFLKNVEEEAVYNVKRLRNHPSVGLYCGNNEIEAAWFHWGWQKQFGWTKEQQDVMWNDYKKIFHQILPEVCKKYDAQRYYQRSSPSANTDSIECEKPGFGDRHYWGVWHGEEPYQAYKKNLSRFLSEYGFQSFPELKTVMAYTTSKDWDIESDVMLHHQRHPKGNPLIREYMFRDYKKPKDFPNFLYVGQVLQGEIIKFAAESHRRAMPYCMGSLYWQLDDCWPVASWSGMDYYGRWKAQHYFAKKFFNSVLISIDEEKNKISTYVISDKIKNFQGKISLSLITFDGKELWKYDKDTAITGNTSKVYFSIDKKDLLKGNKAQEVLLLAKVTEGEQVLSSNIYYFTQPKNLSLPTPKLTYDISGQGNAYTIVLKTDKLAKNVYIQNLKNDLKLSDNYFDLLPGEEKKLVVNSTSEINLEDLKKNIVISTLADTY